MLEREQNIRPSKTPERIRLGLDVLRVLAATTIVVASPAMPKMLKLLPLLKLRRLREYREWDVSRALRRLRSQGFITLVPTRNGFALRPTHQGQVLLERYEIGDYRITNQKRWDGRWRVVIFDIREECKQKREKVRLQFKRWGFFHLQRSVFVYPFDCEDAIEMLKTAYGVRHEIHYLEVSRMAGDRALRAYFGFTKRE